MHDPVLEREGAHPLSLRQRMLDVAKVVLRAAPLLLLGEGGAEVVLEIAAERRDPRNVQPIRGGRATASGRRGARPGSSSRCVIACLLSVWLRGACGILPGDVARER